jgi:hypothetical protein
VAQRTALARLFIAIGLLGARGVRAQDMPMPGAPPPPAAVPLPAAPPPTTPPPPAAALLPLAPAPHLVPPGSPVVTLRANVPRATLQLRTWLTWDDLCTMPCGVPVDAAREYRVAGAPLSPKGEDQHFGHTEPFSLAGRSGPVTVDAHIGRRATHTIGKVLMFAGIMVAPTGALLYAKGSREANPMSVITWVSPHDIGFSLLVGGILATAVGLPLWATSSTSVEVQEPR